MSTASKPAKSRDNHDFEQQFVRLGLKAQRSYPNEALVAFFGRHLFALAPENRRSTRVLELGCGGGANLWMVAREGFDASGVDISETGIEMCRQRLAHWNVEADLRCANMKALPFEDARFDVIFEVHSLQHLDWRGHGEALGEAFRCLKPGGLFFSFHLGRNSYSYTHGQGVKLDSIAIDNVNNPDAPYAGDGLVSFIDPVQARELFEVAGFVVRDVNRLQRLQQDDTVTTEYIVSVCGKPADG